MHYLLSVCGEIIMYNQLEAFAANFDVSKKSEKPGKG